MSLPTGQNIYIRARGYYRSGYQNGSESITESVRNVFLGGQPPVVGNISKSGNEDTQIAFSAANFDAGYSDPNGDVLATVRVTSLPANGTLKLSGSNVAVNQDIARQPRQPDLSIPR